MSDQDELANLMRVKAALLKYINEKRAENDRLMIEIFKMYDPIEGVERRALNLLKIEEAQTVLKSTKSRFRTL